MQSQHMEVQSQQPCYSHQLSITHLHNAFYRALNIHLLVHYLFNQAPYIHNNILFVLPVLLNISWSYILPIQYFFKWTSVYFATPLHEHVLFFSPHYPSEPLTPPPVYLQNHPHSISKKNIHISMFCAFVLSFYSDVIISEFE